MYKKLSAPGGLPLDQELCLWTPLGLRPQTPFMLALCPPLANPGSAAVVTGLKVCTLKKSDKSSLELAVKGFLMKLYFRQK